MVKGGKETESGIYDGRLNVTCQQSRFHSEATVDDGGIREIVVKDLNISIQNRELLSHAEFQLQPGRHYVLAGRNGMGKSTLLQAIAGGHITSIPLSTQIVLLDQIQAKAGVDASAAAANETVLQHVLRSDKTRERLLSEARRLSANTSSSTDTVRTYRQILHERRERDLFDARHAATKLSGARGAKARKVVVSMEEEVAELQSRLDALDIGNAELASNDPELGEEYQSALDLSSEIQSQLEQMSASATEAQARAVLLGLGFSVERLDTPIRQLSGGWTTRCALASALWRPTDLLLLDEPTNFLDLPSIIWLERYIQNELLKATVIVVTHDRAFADNVGEELLILRNLILEHFRGTLSAYEVERRKNYKYLSTMREAQEKQKKHIQSSIDHGLKAAKKKGDDKKLKQVASRRKKLDERMGMEVSAKGTRFKLNRDLPGFHLTLRDGIDVPTFDPPPRMAIPTSPPDLRFPGALITFEKVTFAYGKEDAPILREIDLTIHLGDRVGLAGLNGSGKTTLVRLAKGGTQDDSRSKLGLRSGSITCHPRVRIGHFSQQAVDDLVELASTKPELTALSHLQDHAGSDLTEKDARALLSGVGLQGRTSEVPLALLSGGQKVRLALAKLFFPPPHLLVLDEVTTHLDADTITALASSLRRYEGALWLVTHDRFFMRCVIEMESARAMLNRDEDDDDNDSSDVSTDDDGGEGRVAKPGVVYRLFKAKLTKLDGGMQEYEAKAAKASSRMKTT